MMSYSDLILGLCVNADTYEETDSSTGSGSSINGVLQQRPAGQRRGRRRRREEREGEMNEEAEQAQEEEEEEEEEENEQTYHQQQQQQQQQQQLEEQYQQQPFNSGRLGRFDFRLKPTNFAPGFKTYRTTTLMDWDEISKWYPGQHNLVREIERKEYVAAGLRFSPYQPNPPAGEPVVRHATEPLDDEEPLRLLREHGVNLRPVWVEGDGSCLVHAISTALTGSQIYYDALRWDTHKELRDHGDFYRQAGMVTEQDKARFMPQLEAARATAAEQGLVDREKGMREALAEMQKFNNGTARPKWTQTFLEEAVEKARPSEGELRGPAQYLEEIHVAALANVLKRPIMILAEGFQGGLFLPLRHDPEACRMEDGRASPPIFVYLQYDHYIPLVTQDPRDFWAWAEGPEGFQGDDLSLVALRAYEEERLVHNRIPEFLEEILTYAVGATAEGMENLLRTYEVALADRELYRQAFGHPKQMESLPLKVVFEEQPVYCKQSIKKLTTMNLVFKSLGIEVKDEAPGADGRDVVYLSVGIHELDYRRYTKILWAIYYLHTCQYHSSSPAAVSPSSSLFSSGLSSTSSSSFCLPAPSTPSAISSPAAAQESALTATMATTMLPIPAVAPAAPAAPTAPGVPPAPPGIPGVLPSTRDVDQSVYKFVLNYTQNDTLNLGLARLYCEPEGWDVRPTTSPARDPKDFLTQELARLENRFCRLTGLDFKRVMEEDNKASQQGTVGLGATPTDFRSKLPKALLALQSVLRTRPYPGRSGSVQSSHILLADAPSDLLCWCTPSDDESSSSGSSSNGSSSPMDVAVPAGAQAHQGQQEQQAAGGGVRGGGGGGGRTVSLAEVDLNQCEARRELVKQLLLRGLPQNQHFEQVACAVLLHERFNEARTRFCFMDWIINAASSMLPNLLVEYSEAAASAIRKITVAPLPQGERRELPMLSTLFPGAGSSSLSSSLSTSAAAVPPAAAQLQSIHSSSSSSSASSATSTASATCWQQRQRSPSPEESYVMINGHGAEPQESTLAATAAPAGAGNDSPALKKPAYHTKRSTSVNGNSKTTAVPMPVAVGVSVGVMGGRGNKQRNGTTSITTGGGLRPQSVGVKRGSSMNY